ncbi:MAG TPA: UDP binding domain-containing protein, partial [Stellaceae bacterium]|nr:UDP binding domain-containing protein [Stellaceae bacterium]
FALVAERVGVDVWRAIDLANRHPRVQLLRPGPGVGGHCIAVDPWFIVATAPEQARLIRVAREVNDAKPDFICNKVKERARALRHPVIACLGLSYKKDVDDLRESPAVEIVERLAAERVGELLVVEPHIRALPAELAAQGLALSDFDEAVERADIVLLLVDHSNFMFVDRERLKDKILIDTRGAW